MKFLARICRLIVSLVFIFSGFVKLLSPVGTSLVIKEYLIAFHIGFLTPASLVIGITLAATEFLTGVALLLRLRFRLAAWVALLLIALFTPLTLYLALFNPIADCGCFGEAVHLTNWQTFFKNLILLPCVVIIFFSRKKVGRYTYPALEWVFVGLFALLATAVLLQTFLWAPLAEFTDYKVGNEIKAAPSRSAADLYETVFIYEKDGVQESFTLDNLPDSTWTFVDAVTKSNGLLANAADADFRVEAPDGTDITTRLLEQDKLLMMTIYHPDKFVRRHGLEPILKVKEGAVAQGLEFVLVASDKIEELPDDCPVNLADLKLLMTHNRSNGGVTLLDEGIIIRKWTAFRAMRQTDGFCGQEDPEFILLMTLNRQRMSMETVVVVFILLCLAKFIVFFRKKE